MFGLFDFSNSDTVYLRNFYASPFTGDPKQEQIRTAKVAEVIESMGDKYVLAKPVKRLTEEK